MLKLEKKASVIEEQQHVYQPRKKKPPKEESDICKPLIAISILGILIGAVLTTYVNVVCGAIVITVGCLGLVVSLYELQQGNKEPDSSIKDLSKIRQFKQVELIKNL